MSRQQRIDQALREAFAPSFLSVLDESRNHAVPEGAESHFRVVIVSESFRGAPRVQRHRAVNRVLADELNGGLHALAIEAWTEDQEPARQAILASPDCLGGSKAEKRAPRTDGSR